VASAVANAKALLVVQKEFGSFDDYIWQFVGDRTIHNAWKSHSTCPAKTEESIAMSKDLIQRGFKFVGPTICYAYMQAAGLVNDHTVDCFRYKQLKQTKRASR
jgi:DNA-3-methyladenine glycosylase I